MKKLLTLPIVLLVAVSTMLAQRTITGTVSDAAGDPLPGVNVVVKGTDVGTATDGTGMYSIRVAEENAALIFSYIGYSSQEVALGASNVVDVTLTEGVLLQEGVVVTALGISRERKKLGYAVQELDGGELEIARDPSALNALSGKVAGLQIISSSGNVGSSSRVVIRGNASITGNSQPLFVINGVPISNTTFNSNGQYGGADYGSPIADINPDDIESISVLKGPNAAALYGARATNGVILVTTKSGKGAKKGVSVSYSGNIGFSDPFRLPDYQSKFGQGIGGQFKYVDGTGLAAGNLFDGVDESWGPAFDQSITQNDGIDNNGDGVVDEAGEGALIDQHTGANQPWLAQPNTIRDVFRTGVTMSNNIAVSMNNDNMYSRMSYTNFSQEGMLPNTNLRRNTFNMSTGMKMNEKLSADANFTYTRTDSDNRPGIGYAGDNIMQQTIWTGRQVDWQDLEANYNNRDEFGQYYNWNHNYQNNPFFTLYNNVKPMNRDRINGFARLTYKLNDWLNVAGRVMNDFYRENRRRIWAKETLDFPNGRFEEDNFSVNEINLELLLNARKEVSDKLTIGGTLGLNRRDDNSSLNSTIVRSLTVDGIYNVSNAASNPAVTQTDLRRRVNSVFGLVSFEFDDFLFVDVTGRNDWSSTLPDGSNSYFYPSVNLGLVLSDAMEMPDFIDYLKLRGGWAQVGSDTDPYRLRLTYAANDPWGGVPSFAAPNNLPATSLSPEISNSIEAGLDLNMFDNRVGLDVTYYNSETRDQIIPVDASPSTGFTNRVTNAGTLVNNGIELSLNLAIVRTPDVSWNMQLNWAKNNSEVKDLPEGIESILLGNYWGLRLEAREGEPYGIFRGLSALYNDAGDIVLSGGVPQIDPQPDPNDPTGLAKLGTITPDWIGGMRNTVSYKNLSLSFLVDVRKGSDLFSMTYMFGRYAGAVAESLEGRNTAEEVRNGYVYEGVVDNGDGTYSPNTTPVDAETWNVYYWRGLSGHDRSVFDASFVKLREVTLGYDMPKKWFENNFIEDLRLSVYGRNLLLIHSNVPHVDPETAFSSDTDVQGFEFGQTPSARTYGLQLNARF